MSCLAAITPLIYAWEAQNTAGDTKRKCTSAVVLVGMCAGNVCLLLISLHRLLSFIGHWSPTIFHIASTALSAWVDFQSDNVRYRSRVFYVRGHPTFRSKLRLTGQNDESVPGVPEQETGKEKTRPGQVRPHCRRVHAQQKASGGKGAGTGGDRSCATAPTEDKGFSDSTDLKNEDFVYVY